VEKDGLAAVVQTHGICGGFGGPTCSAGIRPSWHTLKTVTDARTFLEAATHRNGRVVYGIDE